MAQRTALRSMRMTGAAGKGLPFDHGVRVSEWTKTKRWHRRSKERNRWGIHRAGQMQRSGIVADEDATPGEERRRPQQGELPGGINH
jgi:hypothetical protein